jgi:hypothetical protein
VFRSSKTVTNSSTVAGFTAFKRGSQPVSLSERPSEPESIRSWSPSVLDLAAWSKPSGQLAYKSQELTEMLSEAVNSRREDLSRLLIDCGGLTTSAVQQMFLIDAESGEASIWDVAQRPLTKGVPSAPGAGCYRRLGEFSQPGR